MEALGRPIDAIAINAGVGVGGPFVDTDLEAEINLTVTALQPGPTDTSFFEGQRPRPGGQRLESLGTTGIIRLGMAGTWCVGYRLLPTSRY